MEREIVFIGEDNQALTSSFIVVENEATLSFIKEEYPTMGSSVYLCRDLFGGYITNGQLMVSYVEFLDKLIAYSWRGNTYEAIDILHFMIPHGHGFLYYAVLKSIAETIIQKDRVKSEDQKTYILFDVSSNIYKIGKSFDISARVKAHKSSNPSVILIAFVNKNIESELHKLLKEYTVYSEWYNVPKKVIEKIIKDHEFIRIQK